MAKQYSRDETDSLMIAVEWARSEGHITGFPASHKAREFAQWVMMLSRCYNPVDLGYENEGGRGVKVCDEWNPARGGSFDNFYRDMGPMPSNTKIQDDDDNDDTQVKPKQKGRS